MPSCFRCSVACNVFLLFVPPPSLRLAPNETPRGGSDSHQSDRIHLLSTWSRNSLHHSCLNYAWSLSGNEKLVSLFHFPFSLFPFQQKFTTLQTSPSKDQRMSNIWQLPSNKRFTFSNNCTKRFTFSNTANKGDHRNNHLKYELNIYITYADIYYRQRQDILDVLNAPEIGLLLFTWSHLILLTGHCRHHYYYYSTLHRCVIAKDQSLLQQTPPCKRASHGQA